MIGQGLEADAGLVDPGDEERRAACAVFRAADLYVWRDDLAGAIGIVCVHDAIPLGDDIPICLVEAGRGRDVMVVEEQGASINEIAAELGLDQSNASRMVGAAVLNGYLIKQSAGDARRRVVALSPRGRKLIAQAHRWQERAFAELTADWTAQEVSQCATLMRRLCEAASASGAR